MRHGFINGRKATIWIFFLFVTLAPCPVTQVHAQSPWGDLLKAATGGSSKSKKKGTAVAGVRGLDEPGKETDSEARDYPAVDQMEAVKVSEQEVGEFLAEGEIKPR